MANSVKYKEKEFRIGDTISVSYKFKEGNKDRQQAYKGILIKVRGMNEANRMVTVRKISKSGMGVERIFPLFSPSVVDVKLVKKSKYSKAKAYFVRHLSESQIRHKLYRQK